MTDFLHELEWRGLLHQTAGEGLDAFLRTPGRAGYAGFDPTADSLTIGNLIPITMLTHWQRAGHTPIALMGGGTGLIGDPSGKSAERPALTREQVEANVDAQRRILERLLDFDDSRPNRAKLVNNIDWLEPIGYIEMLREVGKYFSVNAMIQRESVAQRLHHRDHGISYTEFSYMILQAYDFLHLARTLDCRVQMGGSDQFGNILSGIDLIRRLFHAAPSEPEDTELSPAFGITAPLVTRADGGKIGKSESGAIWLSADKTSPYRFYQFWLNADDADVVRFLKWFTLLDRAEIESLEQAHLAAPHQREAHRALARHMTALIHGETERDRAEAAAKALFSGEVRALDAAMLREVAGDVPSSDHARSALEGGGMTLVDLLSQTTLAASKREARQFLDSGAVSVNGDRINADRTLTAADLLHGELILLKRGKKHWHATRWT